MSKFYLSKSQYCTGLGCSKALWLQKKHPELAAPQEDDTSIKNGLAVGELARGIFGSYCEIPLESDKSKMTALTKQLIDRGESVICEASFIYEGLYCAVDVLRNLGGGRVELYEVKAENSPKDINYNDVYFQTYVLRSCGYDVVSANLVYLNRDYVRKGELELDKLFVIENVTEKALAAGADVRAVLYTLEAVLESDTEPWNGLCDGCATKDCPFWGHCGDGLPEPSVFSLSGTGFPSKKKIDCWKRGVVSYPELLKEPKLPERQRKQIEVHLSGKEYINPDGVRETLDKLSYPLYFLDFETFIRIHTAL